MRKNMLAIKSVDTMLAEAKPTEGVLKRELTAWDLMLLGVGAIVGAGIFATIGTAAAGNAARPGAGPSLILSFVITAVVCSFTALCYAELAALVPVSGSAYTYTYATLGELVAWIIGWDLILEYAISNVAIAISWSNYMRVLLAGIGIDVPLWLATDSRTALSQPHIIEAAPHVFGIPIVFNALAVFIVVVLTLLALWGIRESSRVNTAIVMVKLAVLSLFCAAPFIYASKATVVQNWQPFFPNGFRGTLAGAAIAFFAYVGFDSVSTVAEETRDPGRNVPRGILYSLIVCTAVYLAVAAVFCGLIPYDVLSMQLASEQAEPLSLALQHVAPQTAWMSTLIAFGAVVSQTAAILVYQVAQPRIFYVMARDGLLPKIFAKIHPTWRTPYMATIATGLLVGGVSAFASLDEMVDLTNIGTLFAFSLVCAGVPVLRHTARHRTRPFSVPGGPYLVPALGVLSCIGLMVYLPPASWWRFVGWLVVGMAFYAFYGYRHSTLGRELGRLPTLGSVAKRVGAAFSVMAGGLFVLPHEASLGMVAQMAQTGASLGRSAPMDAQRALCGCVLVALGLGFLLSTWSRRSRSQN